MPGRRRENDISKKQILRKSNYTPSLSVFNKNSTLKGKKTNEKNQNAKQCHDPYVFFRILYRFSISRRLHSLALSQKLGRFPLSLHHTAHPFGGRLIYST